MTILPKKKPAQSRAEAENSTDGSALQHLSVVNSNNHLSHIGPVSGHSQVTHSLDFSCSAAGSARSVLGCGVDGPRVSGRKEYFFISRQTCNYVSSCIWLILGFGTSECSPLASVVFRTHSQRTAVLPLRQLRLGERSQPDQTPNEGQPSQVIRHDINVIPLTWNNLFDFHRAVRPKHRDRNERNSSSSAVASTSGIALSAGASPASNNGNSPVPGPEPSSSYSCEDESGSGYNSGDEYGPGRSSNIPVTEEEWEQVRFILYWIDFHNI